MMPEPYPSAVGKETVLPSWGLNPTATASWTMARGFGRFRLISSTLLASTSQGFNDFVVGAFEDFDDHVMLGYEDEGVSGDDEPGLADLADLADG